MSSADSNPAPILDYAAPAQPKLLSTYGRAFVTLFDQGIVSIATFATNFLLLHHFAKDKEHYAYYTLAFNLMIWIGEVHATLVFTPHTIISPRKSGDDLRRFHGSTLLHHFVVSILATIGIFIAGLFNSKIEMSHMLMVLAAGMIAIGLRNYARPYSFTARKPHVALFLDLAVSGLQIGALLMLQKHGLLNASTAVAVIGASAALPSLVWLLLKMRSFKPSISDSIQDLKMEWPNTRWVFLSGMVWNAGMQLYPWVIFAISGDVEVALWGACYQLAAIANPLLMGLQNFTGPRIAEAFMERTREDFIRFVYRTAIVTALLMVGPAILISLFADGALSWISKGEFQGHQTAITFLCGAFMFQAITFTLSRGLFALHRADLDLYCNFGPLVLMLTGGMVLVHQYGATGAAIGLLLAQVISVLSRIVLFQYAGKHAKDKTPIESFPEEVVGSQ